MLSKLKNNFDSAEEALLFIKVFSLITILPLMLKFSSFSDLLKILTPQNCNSKNILGNKPVAFKITKFTDYILRRNLMTCNRKCLFRALVLYHFFRKYGINVQFCMGIRFGELKCKSEMRRKMIGHAWIRYKGKIFMEKDPGIEKRYHETFCFPKNLLT
jgi:hypothetical protein